MKKNSGSSTTLQSQAGSTAGSRLSATRNQSVVLSADPFCRASGVHGSLPADPSRDADFTLLTEPTPEVLALPDSYAKRLLMSGLRLSAERRRQGD
jgi:hypothetical protein